VDGKIVRESLKSRYYEDKEEKENK